MCSELILKYLEARFWSSKVLSGYGGYFNFSWFLTFWTCSEQRSIVKNGTLGSWLFEFLTADINRKIRTRLLLPSVLPHTFHRAQQHMGNQTNGHVYQEQENVTWLQEWKYQKNLRASYIQPKDAVPSSEVWVQFIVQNSSGSWAWISQKRSTMKPRVGNCNEKKL